MAVTQGAVSTNTEEVIQSPTNLFSINFRGETF